MSNSKLVDVIAAVSAIGSSGNVGHELAERIAAAVEAAEKAEKAKPVVVEKVPGPGGITDGLNPKVVSIDPPMPKVSIDAPKPVHFAGRPPNPKPYHRPKGK